MSRTDESGRDGLREALAEAEIRGQMKHITAEVARGDQPLGEKEDLIADLRARLSHVEAERDDLRRRVRDLADGDLWEHADALHALVGHPIASPSPATPAVEPAEVAVEERALDDGVRQAIAWLRAGYEYGTGPYCREWGADWIADRLADHNRERRA